MRKLFRTKSRAAVGLAIGTAFTAAIAWGVTKGLDTIGEGNGSRFHVTVESDPGAYAAGPTNTHSTDYVLPGAILGSERPPGEICRDWHRWALQRGGVQSDITKVQVTLQAEEGAAILLDGLDVLIASRRPPMHGYRALCRTGGAYGVLRGIAVDLDARPPAVAYKLDDNRGTTKPLRFTLSGTETEIFEIRAVTRTFLCDWTARLHLLVDGKRRTVKISDRGRPFRTTSARGRPAYEWNGRRWVRNPELDRFHSTF